MNWCTGYMVSVAKMLKVGAQPKKKNSRSA